MENRYLLWFCLSFVVTAIICGICPTALGFVVFLGIFVAGCLLFLFKREAKASAALLVFGLGFSLVWQSVFFSSDELARELLRNDVLARITVTSFSEQASGELSFTGKLVHNDKTVRLIVYADDFGMSLKPGDVVESKLRIFEVENTEFFAQKTYYKSRYIDAIANASEIKFITTEKHSKLIYFAEYAANKLKMMAETLYRDKEAGFMRALLLGDTSGLSAEFKNRLQKIGISHAVSVSGMHISFFVSFIIFFTKNKFLKLITIPVIFCFALIVGAPQSALRAVIMQSLFLLSDVKKREYDPLTAVFFAAFVLVFINPYCATDIAFLLSFSATLGIILLFPKIFAMFSLVGKNLLGMKRKIFNAVASIVGITVSALLFTSPISAYTFNTVSVIAPISNVLLSPVISLIFAGGFVSLLLGFIFIPFGKGIATLISFVIEFAMNVINFLSNFKYAEIFAGEAVAILTVSFLCLVVIYSILAGRKKIRIWYSIAVAAIAFFAVFTVKFYGGADEKYDGIRFDVLDVGQGQCIVATSGDECVVIDCGGDKDADNIAIFHLLKRQIPDIDALILTHAHADHTNGVHYLTEIIKTSAVYMPASDKHNSSFVRLEENLKDKSEIFYVEEDTTFSLSDIDVSILTLPGGKDENENGLVILLSDEEYDMLITGDIPSKLEKEIVSRLPDCESYIVGHHGSKSSSSQVLLNKALPELCVISVGKDNSYGHPASETIERIKKIGANIARTDIVGNITIYSRR